MFFKQICHPMCLTCAGSTLLHVPETVCAGVGDWPRPMYVNKTIYIWRAKVACRCPKPEIVCRMGLHLVLYDNIFQIIYYIWYCMCDHIWQHPNYSQWWYVLLWWYEDIGYLPFSVKKNVVLYTVHFEIT